MQMRLNTYSKKKKCRQCVSGLSPSQGEKGERLGGTKLEGARVKPADTVRLIHFSGVGFSICMLLCNSRHYITCRQQSNSCAIVEKYCFARVSRVWSCTAGRWGFSCSSERAGARLRPPQSRSSFVGLVLR